MKLLKCILCGQQGDLKAVEKKNHLEALSFLTAVTEITKAELCSKCHEKVALIAGIKQESNKDVTEKPALPSAKVVTDKPFVSPKVVNKEDLDDDDVDLEELDLLSRFVWSFDIQGVPGSDVSLVLSVHSNTLF